MSDNIQTLQMELKCDNIQALQMELKCLTYMSGVTIGFVMPDILSQFNYKWN